MIRKLVKLSFKSPFHIGTDIPGIGVENVLHFAHSDTLFSCFMNSYAMIFDLQKCNTLINHFQTEYPPFHTTSSFPYSEKNNKTKYYLPKPLTNPPHFYGSDAQRQKHEYGKNLKKTSYLTIEDYKEWLAGSENFELKDLDKRVEKPYLTEMRAHHTQDRLTSASAIYHIGTTHFIDGGLYFIAEIDEQKISMKEFEKVWQNAGIYGLGGRRSTGNGIFEPKFIDLPTEFVELFAMESTRETGYITLSLYFPETTNFEQLQPVAYNIIQRKGWTFSVLHSKQMKRNICNMFAESSVFGNKPTGKLVDVTPKGFYDMHNVYRLGQPLCLPIKLFKEQNNE